MNRRTLAHLFAIPALATLALAAHPASAQEPDGARFRGGVSLEGGALINPSFGALGTVGVQGQLGAQITHRWGVYAVPSVDVVVGSVLGLQLGGAVLADYTFGDHFTLGAGPDSSVFVVAGGGGIGGGALYGGRVHFAWNPVVVRGDNGIRRKALTIGLDVRLLASGVGESSSSGGSATAFIVAPQLSVGYVAF